MAVLWMLFVSGCWGSCGFGFGLLSWQNSSCWCCYCRLCSWFFGSVLAVIGAASLGHLLGAVQRGNGLAMGLNFGVIRFQSHSGCHACAVAAASAAPVQLRRFLLGLGSCCCWFPSLGAAVLFIVMGWFLKGFLFEPVFCGNRFPIVLCFFSTRAY